MEDYGMMTPYEKRIANGLGKSDADRLRDSRLIEDKLKSILGMVVSQTLDDGTEVQVSVMDSLILRKVSYDMEHPERIDLVAYRKAAGENVERTETTVRTADQLFGDIAIKENGNDL